MYCALVLFCVSDDHGREDKDKVPVVSGSQPPAPSVPPPKLPEELTEIPVNPSEAQIDFEEDRHNFALAKDGAKVLLFLKRSEGQDELSTCAR